MDNLLANLRTFSQSFFYFSYSLRLERVQAVVGGSWTISWQICGRFRSRVRSVHSCSSALIYLRPCRTIHPPFGSNRLGGGVKSSCPFGSNRLGWGEIPPARLDRTVWAGGEIPPAGWIRLFHVVVGTIHRCRSLFYLVVENIVPVCLSCKSFLVILAENF